MKRLAIILAAILVLTGAVQAFAASFEIQPGVYNMKVEPGKAATVQFNAVLTVDPARTDPRAPVDPRAAAPAPAFKVVFVMGVEGQAAWVSAPQTVTFATGSTTPVPGNPLQHIMTIPLKVSVPAAAAAGKYTFIVRAVRADSPQMPVTSMASATLNVEVPAGCTERPVLDYTAVLPEGKIVPNNKPVDVVLKGKVSVPARCNVKGAWALVQDEYGEFSGRTPISIGSDGSFSVKLTVQASRKGSDKDGRQYLFGVEAEDEAGRAQGQSFEMRILHDQR